MGFGHSVVNGLLSPLGIRVVNRRWGPRGVLVSLEKAGAVGIVPDQVVDIGASNGAWTRQCLRLLPNARYFLVDPLVENRQSLETLSAEHPKVSHWTGALGREPGHLDFFVHGTQSSFLHSEFSGDGTNTRRIEVRTLDSFLEDGELAPPQLMKADVQGFELDVLRGATECLRSTELVMLEVSYQAIYENAPLAHEVIAAMGHWGFRIFDVCTYVQRLRDGALMQSDILFARDGSQLFADRAWR
ncbi:MAG: FkbM family methyltransferase [Planctomycetota bacterium]